MNLKFFFFFFSRSGGSPQSRAQIRVTIFGGSSGLYCWLWDEEFVWGCGVYTDCWGWFADLVRQGLGLLWFANLVG